MRELLRLSLYSSTVLSLGSNGNLWAVTRIPGGWIYEKLQVETPVAVFVPFNTEFAQAAS